MIFWRQFYFFDPINYIEKGIVHIMVLMTSGQNIIGTVNTKLVIIAFAYVKSLTKNTIILILKPFTSFGK